MAVGGGVEVEEGVTRVLLVDDSPVDRRVAQLLLSSASCAGSFHVIAVDSAKKAMEFLGLKDGKEQAIDMVLTDYCMPEMTGYDLLKAVKALNPLKPIPVIVMSSEDEPQRISRCLSAGAEDFIVKPLQSKDVQRLRNCSTARPNKGSPPCECDAAAKRKPLVLPPSSTAAAASPSGRRANFAGVAMVLPSSRVELSQYFPLLLKLVVLVYAVLCVGELLHRWSSRGGCSLALWCA
ncbi:two-component response regulator ORR1-like [Panicum miliaceum]|uniref:Two-component response regulator ORR1-like n=1 Tax=Panicum miliaceum TaxID=4540 RepID=A0A3L6PW48_PANMI|nr:two-component response regulator ORR1-like [Panicum miliaceum]